MRARVAGVCLIAALAAACGYESAYEEAVSDYEPIYCYQHLGGISCYRTPLFRDQRRIVNYYGPAPSRYDPPKPPPAPRLAAPPPVDRFHRDPEPVPGADLPTAGSVPQSGGGEETVDAVDP
jgi:hypothetical protein